MIKVESKNELVQNRSIFNCEITKKMGKNKPRGYFASYDPVEFLTDKLRDFHHVIFKFEYLILEHLCSDSLSECLTLYPKNDMFCQIADALSTYYAGDAVTIKIEFWKIHSYYEVDQYEPMEEPEYREVKRNKVTLVRKQKLELEQLLSSKKTMMQIYRDKYHNGMWKHNQSILAGPCVGINVWSDMNLDLERIIGSFSQVYECISEKGEYKAKYDQDNLKQHEKVEKKWMMSKYGMEDLPHDILLHIFYFLPIPSLLSANLTRKRWYIVSYSEELWKSVIARFPKITPPKGKYQHSRRLFIEYYLPLLLELKLIEDNKKEVYVCGKHDRTFPLHIHHSEKSCNNKVPILSITSMN